MPDRIPPLERKFDFDSDLEIEQSLPAVLTQRRIALRKLIKTSGFEALKECAEIIVSNYGSGAPPLKDDQIHGYMVFNIVRDALNQVFALAQSEANKAPEDEGEVIHVN